MPKVEAVIFDWAGTTVDYGCFAPVQAFIDAFEKFGITPTNDEVRKPMGMLKIEHIKTMLNMERIRTLWIKKYAREYTLQDVQGIYEAFEESLMQGLDKHTMIKPYVIETVKSLRQKGLKIGSTTGYTDMMMEPVLKSAKEQGYQPDAWFSPDSSQSVGRPYPYMIFRNMEALKLKNVHTIVKVGDTVSDIQEALNAGVYAVGVIEGSSQMGLNEKEYLALSLDKRQALIEKVKADYFAVGAHYVILNLSELEDIISIIENMDNI